MAYTFTIDICEPFDFVVSVQLSFFFIVSSVLAHMICGFPGRSRLFSTWLLKQTVEITTRARMRTREKISDLISYAHLFVLV